MDNRLTAEIRRRGIPQLYEQENSPDPTVYLELSLFGFDWRWFATEANIEDGDVLFFGYVCGFEKEWGYFRLSDLDTAESPLLIRFIEPLPFSELKKERDL